MFDGITGWSPINVYMHAHSAIECKFSICIVPLTVRAVTYNKLVSRPLKYHLTMRVGGYYLLFSQRQQ